MGGGGGGGGSGKTNIEGGLPKKGGLGQFAHLRGGLTHVLIQPSVIASN